MMAYKIFAYSGSKAKSLGIPCYISGEKIDSIIYYQVLSCLSNLYSLLSHFYMLIFIVNKFYKVNKIKME